MLETINTWGDYKARVREFDAVLEHGKALLAALSGQAPESVHAAYGVQIFAKLLAHGSALRGLAPESSGGALPGLADLPSMCALARCVVEAHDAFEYIAGHDVAAVERNFRMLLWELHDETRRLKMFDAEDAAEPHVAALRGDARKRQAELEKHEFLASLPAGLQAALRQRLAESDPPAFHLGQRQRCGLSGVNADWHNAVALQLSQYAYTLPTALLLPAIANGSPEALRLTALPLVLTLPLLVRVTQAVAAFAPGRAPEPPSRTARTMAVWRSHAERGTREAR
ncbi:MAG: hypothetical protein EOP35_16015 [Rubrivivax sp.]|nr:MAG: hypothetical protein EOP35_16015 [Rubrivivax sp.]